MAEGFLKSFDNNLYVYSAGVNPAKQISSKTVKVMDEVGIDISKHYPKSVDDFIPRAFDYVITVCDNAKEECPVFIGKVRYKIHLPFEDPHDAKGTEEEQLAVYRRVRDEIKKEFSKLYETRIKRGK